MGSRSKSVGAFLIKKEDIPGGFGNDDNGPFEEQKEKSPGDKENFEHEWDILEGPGK